MGCEVSVVKEIKLGVRPVSWAQYSVFSPAPNLTSPCMHCGLVEDLHAGTDLYCPSNANALSAQRAGQEHELREIREQINRVREQNDDLLKLYMKGMVTLGVVGLMTVFAITYIIHLATRAPF